MLNDLLFRCRALFRRGVVEKELDEEIFFHFEHQVEKYKKSGMSNEEALRQTRLIFGGHEQIKEDCREARGTSFVENSLQDIRYAARQLRRNPTFTVVMVLTLALSIGANSAIFSVIDGVLVNPLPYTQPQRLVRIFLTNSTYPKFPLNPFDFRDYRTRSKSFDSLAAYTRGDLQLSTGSGRPVRLNGFRITAGFFHVLGLQPEMGHEFEQADEMPGNGRQVILSDRLWRTQFGAAPDIVGRKISLDRQPFTVVGVMPQGTAHPGNEYHSLPYGEDVDIWSPFSFAGDPSQRGTHDVEGIGRMREGVTIGQAQSEMNLIATQLAREHAQDSGWQVLIIALSREVVGGSREMLLMLLGVVVMVLMIACANAANLLLARAATRQQELAVRLALGASRSRLIRQLLMENLLIALLGGGVGLIMAFAGIKALLSILPAGFPRVHEIHVNVPVLAFTLVISLAAGIAFGLMPTIQASRTEPNQGLREGGRASIGSRGMRRLRSALVVSEVGLACLLLVGAGLMLRSLLNLLHLDPGFRQEHVLTANLSLPATEYKTTAVVRRFYDRLSANLSSIPGVAIAGVGSDLPWTGYDENISFTIKGKQPPPHEEFQGRYHVATPDYFRALGIPLLQGRSFSVDDNQDASSVVIINHAMAERYWPHSDAVGKQITFADHPKEKDWFTIIGVVGDVKDSPSSLGTESAFWWSGLQQPYPFSDLSLAILSTSDPELLGDAVRSQVKQLDPSLVVGELREMNQIVHGSLATPRFVFVMVSVFASLAMLLAAVGIYGVIAYSVSQRRAEFGLRVALGAQRFDILRLVLREAAEMVFAGMAMGIILVLALSRVLKNFIYDVKPADPLTFTVAGLLVIVTAIIACYVPARNASKTNPAIALRTN